MPLLTDFVQSKTLGYCCVDTVFFHQRLINSAFFPCQTNATNCEDGCPLECCGLQKFTDVSEVFTASIIKARRLIAIKNP
jgi:hypothetical protein